MEGQTRPLLWYLANMKIVLRKLQRGEKQLGTKTKVVIDYNKGKFFIDCSEEWPCIIAYVCLHIPTLWRSLKWYRKIDRYWFIIISINKIVNALSIYQPVTGKNLKVSDRLQRKCNEISLGQTKCGWNTRIDRICA